MPVLDLRDLIAFPGGDNASDTVIGGVHFNLTTLDFWNYTLYSNGTLSNGSWCLLTFEPYTPSYVLPNGTFLNVTWCYTPVNPIGLRAGVGIGFAVAFGLGLVLTTMNLAKHGKLFLPAEQRFRAIGRRWQWYWAAFTCALALISLIINVDVDRYYLPELPIVLNVFFWYLMQMAAMACVWESIRHWGSWMERQFIDPNPFALKLDDRRARVEFWLPLFFYLWFWLNFFMIVPRNWEPIELQRYPQQIIDVAIPAATDGRFKTAAFCLFICWLTTVFSLRHSVRHYCPQNRGLFNRAVGIVLQTPLRFQAILLCALAIPAYQALAAWEFQWSPLNVHGLNAAIYAGGYAPSLLIVWINVLAGFIRPNEDKELQRQRRVRGEEVDRELGLVRKPAWWRRVNGGQPERMRDRIARNVRELGGGRATATKLDAAIAARMAGAEVSAVRNGNNNGNGAGAGGEEVEMPSLHRIEPNPYNAYSGQVQPGDFAGARALASKYAGNSDRRRSDRTMQAAASLLFPGDPSDGGGNSTTERERRLADLMSDGPPPPPYSDTAADASRGRQPSGPGRLASNGRSNSTSTTHSITAPPQKIRSMLDV